MKKLSVFTGLFALTICAGLYHYHQKTSASTHAVSHAEADSPTVAGSKESERLTSRGTAIIKTIHIPKKEEKPDFTSVFPNLRIVGDVSERHLELIQETLLRLPADKLQNLKQIEIKDVEGENRGLAGSSIIIMNKYDLTDEEFIAVFVHELGHIVDLGGLQGSPAAKHSAFNDGATPIYSNDLSVKYYAYSWENSYEHKSKTNSRDFVSGYAATDPFEDFAESFAYYVLHNQDFKVLAKHNQQLELKYAYIRDFVFAGTELKSGEGDANPNRRVWDITKLAIEL